MGLKDWLGKNHFVTRPGDSDPFFRPRRYQKTREEVVQSAREAIASLKNWRLEEYRENQGLLRVSRSALFPPSAQDINIYVVQGSYGFSSLEMTSISRGTKRDFGQNKRNVRGLLSAVDLRMKPL